MNKFFDIEELNDSGDDKIPEGKSGILIERFLQLHEHRIDSIKNLSGRLPQPGEIFFLWTNKSFNAFTFIPYVIKSCGPIDELCVSTYSINMRIINALERLVEKDLVRQVNLTISDTVQSLYPKVFDHLAILCESKPVRVRYAWNHSKIALLQCADRFFIVEGSGNWGENARHEQYIFLDNRSVFQFRRHEMLTAINTGPA